MADVMKSYVQRVDIDTKAAKKAEVDHENSFTMDQIRTCLNACLAFGGSPTAAARVINETWGWGVKGDWIRKWRDGRHSELYAGLQEEHGAALEDVMIREVRDLARSAMYAERLALDKVIEQMSAPGSTRLNPDQVAANMAKVTDTNVNKLLSLTGRPTAITENRSASDLMRALEAKGVIKTLPVADEES